MFPPDKLREGFSGEASFAFLIDILLSRIDILDCCTVGSDELERRDLEDDFDFFVFLTGDDLKVTFLVPNKLTLIDWLVDDDLLFLTLRDLVVFFLVIALDFFKILVCFLEGETYCFLSFGVNFALDL